MATRGFDPGGVGRPPPPSYASRVKGKYIKLDRNVLEIVIEKKIENKYIHMNGDEVSRICDMIGVKVVTETQGYQTHYTGKFIVLAVWMKQGVSLERFLRAQPVDYGEDLTITQVRPAIRREVTMLVSGLSFNTPDVQVIAYIEKFGAKVVGTEPIYGIHKEGPWAGQYNGERRYRADFSSQKCAMGTYHLIDGAKVRVMYPGNTKTCGRCHQPPSGCIGGGIARVCGESGGNRVSLAAHMRQLWARVDYNPQEELPEEEFREEPPSYTQSQLRTVRTDSELARQTG